MYYRYDLTDAQWYRIANLLPRPLPPRPGAAIPGRTTAPWSTASSGTCTPAPPGPTPPSATAPGRPSTTASTAGARTAPGPTSSTPCCSNSTRPGLIDRDLWCCRWHHHPCPHGCRRGGKKIRTRRRVGRAQEATQCRSRRDHALGRSRGGFGTKTHLVCDSHGIILAVWVTAGQRHETQGFEQVMDRARRPRRAGRPTLAGAGGGGQGLQLPRVRDWLKRRHIEPVIPTRKDQPRERGLRQGQLPAAEHHRAGGGLVQVVPGVGVPLRQAGRQLRRPVDHRQYPMPPPKVSRSARCPFVRNDLAGTSLPEGTGRGQPAGCKGQGREERRKLASERTVPNAMLGARVRLAEALRCHALPCVALHCPKRGRGGNERQRNAIGALSPCSERRRTGGA